MPNMQQLRYCLHNSTNLADYLDQNSVNLCKVSNKVLNMIVKKTKKIRYKGHILLQILQFLLHNKTSARVQAPRLSV